MSSPASIPSAPASASAYATSATPTLCLVELTASSGSQLTVSRLLNAGQKAEADGANSEDEHAGGWTAASLLSRAEECLQSLGGADVVQRVLREAPSPRLSVLLAFPTTEKRTQTEATEGADKEGTHHQGNTISTAVGVAVVRCYVNSFNGPVKVWLEALHVVQGWRSKRMVGPALLRAVRQLALRRGAAEFVAMVDSMNAAAVRFFMRERLNLSDFGFVGPAAFKSAECGSDESNNNSCSLSSGNSSPEASRYSPPDAAFDVVEITRGGTGGGGSPPGLQERYNCPAWLEAMEVVHRQLHARFAPGHEAYAQLVRTIASEGGRILLAVRRPTPSADEQGAAPVASNEAAPVVLGLCIHRFFSDLSRGGSLRQWTDDLVVDASLRSQGVGKALMHLVRLQALATHGGGGSGGMERVELDSGPQRARAHQFYFKCDMSIQFFSLCGEVAEPKQNAAAAVAAH